MSSSTFSETVATPASKSDGLGARIRGGRANAYITCNKMLVHVSIRILSKQNLNGCHHVFISVLAGSCSRVTESEYSLGSPDD